MKKVTILLFITIFLLCGCTNIECVKSHEEKGRCVRYTTILAGKTAVRIPHHYYCTKTICDEYKEVKR